MRSLCQKVHRFEKSTPLPVVAVVTNMSYDVQIVLINGEEGLSSLSGIGVIKYWFNLVLIAAAKTTPPHSGPGASALNQSQIQNIENSRSRGRPI